MLNCSIQGLYDDLHRRSRRHCDEDDLKRLNAARCKQPLALQTHRFAADASGPVTRSSRNHTARGDAEMHGKEGIVLAASPRELSGLIAITFS